MRRTTLPVVAVLLTAATAHGQTPDAATVPWVAAQPNIPHDIISGRATRLKGAEIGFVPAAGAAADGTVDSIHVEVLTTCSTDSMTLSLNGVAVSTFNADGSHCTCTPPGTNKASTTAPAALAAWNGADVQANVARFQKAGGSTYAQWAAVTVVDGNTAQRICIFDRGGANCSNTNICAGAYTPAAADFSRTGAWAAAAAPAPSMSFLGATYQWEYGDGGSTGFLPVTNPRVLEASRTYNAAVGSPFTARLTVCSAGGACDTVNYPMVVRADNIDTRVNVAIDEGLWYLYKRANATSGQIQAEGSYGEQISATASAVNAFEAHGHLEAGNRSTNPYVDVVAGGLRYVLTNMSSRDTAAQTAGNPDSNGNTKYLTVLNGTNEVYQNGMLMDALVASATPNAVVTAGPMANTQIAGRPYNYRDAVQDLVDGYAFGQMENAGAPQRGSWYYTFANNGAVGHADNSSSQWAAIGMIPAERQWGVTVPQFVKNENLSFAMAGTRAANGSFGYSSTACIWGCAATTPSGMVQLIFDGVPSNDARFSDGARWMADNWGAGSADNTINTVLGYTYGLFAAYKAGRLAVPPVPTFTATNGTVLDWYNDPTRGIRSVAVARQLAAGNWNATGGAGQNGMATQWYLLMLAPTLFQQGPRAVAEADPSTVAIGQVITFSHDNSFHLDPARHIVRYDWDFDSNGTIDFTTADPNAQPTFAYNPDPHGVFPQVFTATLTVVDDNNPVLTDTSRVQITVRLDNVPPVARITPAAPSGVINTPIPLSGATSSDPNAGGPLNDSITEYAWDLDASNGLNQFTTIGVNVNAQFATAGDHDVALRVTDSFGAQHVAFATVNVIANRPPVADATPDGETFECTSAAGTSVALNGSLSMDPDVGDTISYQWSSASGVIDPDDEALTTGTFGLGAHTATLTVADALGASDTDLATFSIVDSTAPALACNPVDAECQGALTVVPLATLLAAAHATDACDDSATVALTSSQGPYQLGVTAIGYIAVDDTGNSVERACEVRVTDTLAPQVVACAAAEAECAGALTRIDFAPEFVDQCDATLAISPNPVGGTFPLGHSDVSFRATDDSGRFSECATRATVFDTTDPTIDCHGPAAAIECTGPLTAVAVSAEGSDTCDDSVDIVQQPAGGDFGLGTTTVQFTAVDQSANGASCSVDVQVVDTTPPSITCPADQTVECTGGGMAEVDPGDASGSDLCQAVTVSEADTAFYGLGDTDVVFTASAGGLDAECTTVITVEDTTAPTIACPADATLVLSADTCEASADFSAAWSDVCSGDQAIAHTFSFSDTGSETFEYAATDAGGLSASCSQTVTAVDQTAPSASAGADQTGLEADASCNVSVHLEGSGGDACGPVTYRWTEGDRELGTTAALDTTLSGVGAHTLTLTVCDESGNCTSDDVVVTIGSSVMTCFKVSKVNLKLEQRRDNRCKSRDGHGHGRDDDRDSDSDEGHDDHGNHLYADGTFTTNGCSNVDFATTGASVTVDGATFTVPAGGFRAIGRSGKFRYRSPRAGHAWWELVIDPANGTWKFKAHHVDEAGLSPADGLSFTLVLGNQVGRQTVAVRRAGHSGTWNYQAPRNERPCPKPAPAPCRGGREDHGRCDDGDSDSDSDRDSDHDSDRDSDRDSDHRR